MSAAKMALDLRRILPSKRVVLLVILFLALYLSLVLPWRIFMPLRNMAAQINDISTVFSFFSFSEPEDFYKDLTAILIDDDSIKNFSSKWPLNRDIYAQLLNVLNEDGARVVGFDLVFAGKGQEQEDALLRKAIDDFRGKLVFAYYFDRNFNPIAPHPDVIGNATTGFINTPSDAVGVTRTIEAYKQVDGRSDFCFSIKIASLFLDAQPVLEKNRIRLGDRVIPLNRHDSFYLLFFQPKPLFKREFIPMTTLWRVLQRDYPKDLFRDKIVVVGPAAKIIGDFHFTPIGRFPGVFIHLNSLLNILNKRVVDQLPLFTLWAVLGVLVLWWASAGGDIIRTIVSSIAYLLVLFWIDITGMRYFQAGFNYGQVFLFMIGGMLIIGGFNYLSFFYSINNAKNKAVSDPLFGLFIFNYFCFRLGLERERIYFNKNKYLVFIILERFLKETKKVGFAKLRKTWERINGHLKKQKFSYWGTFTDDKIIGCMILPKEAHHEQMFEDMRKVIEGLFQIEGVDIKVRLGFRPLTKVDRGLDYETFLPVVFERLQQRAALINDLSGEVILPQADSVGKREYSAEFEQHIEDKNQRLLGLIEELRKEQRQREDAYLELLRSLVYALEAKDEYTKGHSQRVSDYAVMLAQKLNLSEDEIDNLRKAGTMHDVGKIGLPDAILHKRGRLTDEEYVVVKKHAQMGATIIAPIKFFENLIPYILYHHERVDGRGYPKGLKGEDIPVGAQIMSIADVFDALTTARDYKPAFSVKDAVAELRRVKGMQFNPDLVEKFVEALKEKGLFAQDETG